MGVVPSRAADALGSAEVPMGSVVEPAVPDVAAPPAVLSPPMAPTPDSVGGGERVDRVQVTDPFIELHTFPGRSYPIFFVVPRGDWVAIVLRHTDWFKVRTTEGKEGWVHRQQLEKTLTASSGRPAFREVLYVDNWRRRFEMGSAFGRMSGDRLLKFWGTFRLSNVLRTELTFGQTQGADASAMVWHLNLQAEPWPEQALSPFLGVGVGKFRNDPYRGRAGATAVRSRLADAVIGARYRLNDDFVLRADYTIYTTFASGTRSTDYRAATAGVSFIF